MADLSKILTVYFIFSFVIYICCTLPVDDEKNSSHSKILKSNQSKELTTVPSKALHSEPITNIVNSLISTSKAGKINESITDVPSLKLNDSKIISDVKLKNSEVSAPLNKTIVSSSQDSNNSISNESLKDSKNNLSESSNEQFNKLQQSTSSNVPAKFLTLAAPLDQVDKEKGKESQDEKGMQSEPKNDTGKNVEEEDINKFKEEKIKLSKEQAKEQPKSPAVDKNLKIEESSMKYKENVDDQLPPANDVDIAYKLNEEVESKEKQIHKPDILNYSSDKVTVPFFNKDDDKYDDYRDDDDLSENVQENSSNKQQKVENSSVRQKLTPNKTKEMFDDANSHFFAYLLTVMVMAVLFYLLFHNKQRIIALMIEGRGSRPSRRGTRAKYHKLDNNLEEAMSSMRGGGNGGLNNVY